MNDTAPALPDIPPNGFEMSILKRDIDFGIGKMPAPRWCDDDEIRTAFFDAFSLFLPEGERFFIRSDKTLQKASGAAYDQALLAVDELAEALAAEGRDADFQRGPVGCLPPHGPRPAWIKRLTMAGLLRK